MKKLNLSSLSASELQQLKSEIEKELTDRSSKLQAIEEVKKLAASKGLKLEELFAEMGASKVKGKRELGPRACSFPSPSGFIFDLVWAWQTAKLDERCIVQRFY